MRDIIKVTDENNQTRGVEVITIFQLKNYDYNYIIYKELNEDKNYIAKYHGTDNVKLNTNLSQKELELANTIWKGMNKHE